MSVDAEEGSLSIYLHATPRDYQPRAPFSIYILVNGNEVIVVNNPEIKKVFRHPLIKKYEHADKTYIKDEGVELYHVEPKS
jgi:hypothetical protein